MARGKHSESFEAKKCECCGQAKTYALPLDWGTAVIVKAIARAVRIKGINTVHPTKEMEVSQSEWSYESAVKYGKLTSNQIGNLSRAKAHGLVARNKNEPGNWLLTTKGARFLRGEAVPKIRVRAKLGVTEKLAPEERYWKPETITTTVHELLARENGAPVWEGIDFTIEAGRIVRDLPPVTKQTTLT